MTGFLVFVIIVVAIVVLFRYWRKREMEAFMGADVADFEELSELAGHTKLMESQAPDRNVVSIPGEQVGQQPAPEFELRGAVFDEVHRHCLQTLEQVAGHRYRVLAHVPLQDVVRAERGERQNRLKGESISFLLCEKTSMEMVCGVLLKGSGQSEVMRAEFLDEVFRQIGRPLIVLPMATEYSTLELEESLSGVLDDAPLSRNCPKCGKEMLMRKAVKGRNAGKSFWVCKEFPSCKGIMRI